MHQNPWTCSRNDNGSRKRAHDVTSRMPDGTYGSVGTPGGAIRWGHPANHRTNPLVGNARVGSIPTASSGLRSF